MIRRIMAYCLDGFDGRAIPAAAAPPQQPCALSAPGSMATGNPFTSPLKPNFWKPTRSTWKRTAPILSVLRQGGVAVIRVIYECGHYVLVTGLGEPDRLLVFDGYYEEGRDIEDLVREGIGIIPDPAPEGQPPGSHFAHEQREHGAPISLDRFPAGRPFCSPARI